MGCQLSRLVVEGNWGTSGSPQSGSLGCGRLAACSLVAGSSPLCLLSPATWSLSQHHHGSSGKVSNGPGRARVCFELPAHAVLEDGESRICRAAWGQRPQSEAVLGFQSGSCLWLSLLFGNGQVLSSTAHTRLDPGWSPRAFLKTPSLNAQVLSSLTSLAKTQRLMFDLISGHHDPAKWTPAGTTAG